MGLGTDRVGSECEYKFSRSDLTCPDIKILYGVNNFHRVLSLNLNRLIRINAHDLILIIFLFIILNQIAVKI
jgi:hypothetical protein